MMTKLGDVPLCTKCGNHPASHFGSRCLCCRCYVGEGNPPADWHPVCMQAYAERKP